MTLYQLTQEWEEVFLLLEDPEVDDQAVYDTIEGIEGEIANKADSYGIILQRLQNEAQELKTEKARLAERQKNIENRIDALKKNLMRAMKAAAMPKIQTPKFSFSVAKTPEAVVIDEITDELFEAYHKPQKRDEDNIDKTRIKELLKAGQEIPGCRLEAGEALRMR